MDIDADQTGVYPIHMGIYGEAFSVVLADQLRAERSAARLSQGELAVRAGMSEQTVMRYLNGTRDIPMAKLADLAHALGLSVQTIVERAEQRMPKQPAPIARLNVPSAEDTIDHVDAPDLSALPHAADTDPHLADREPHAD